MSREVKRVALDFQWPMNKRWEGYLTPDELRLPGCADCGGRGYSGAGEWLETLMYRLSMLARHVVEGDGTLHPWLAEDPYPPTRQVMRPVTAGERLVALAAIERCEAEGKAARPDAYRNAKPGADTLDHDEVVAPSADIVDLVVGLSGQSPDRLGRGGGSTTAYRMVKAVVEAAGLDPDTWGQCPTCQGRGHLGTPEQRASEAAWERTEPPEGPGWQLWETVSEGSPISPVFPDRQGLVDWLCTDYSWGAHKQPMTRSAAEALVEAGDTLGATFATVGGVVIQGEEMPEFMRNRVSEDPLAP